MLDNRWLVTKMLRAGKKCHGIWRSEQPRGRQFRPLFRTEIFRGWCDTADAFQGIRGNVSSKKGLVGPTPDFPDLRTRVIVV